MCNISPKVLLSGILCVVAAALLTLVFMTRKRQEVQPQVLPESELTIHLEPAIRNGRLAAPSMPDTLAPSLESITVPLTREESLLKDINGLNISDAVRIVIGAHPGKADRSSRMEAIKRLPRTLSEDDVKALCLFLDSKFDEKDDLPAQTTNAIKNDVLDILLRQNKMLEGIGGRMARMFMDKGHDDVWRDYCIQYLATYYEAKCQPASASDEYAERDEITNAYWQAAAEKDKTFAGTALIGLERLSRKHAEFDRKKIEDVALALAMDDECLESSRITALRMCGMMEKTEVLPSARILAQTGETVPVRMAAIATIGDLGDERDIELVKAMAADSNERIRGIAESSLKRLKSTVGQ